MTSVRALGVIALGTALGAILAGATGFAPGTWRAPVMGAAAGSTVVGLARLWRLALAEWRRQRPGVRRYAGAVLPLLGALLLAGLATA